MKKSSVMRYEVPQIHFDFAYKRVNDLVLWFGRFISHYSHHDLAIACYLQGVQDTFQLLDKNKPPEPPNDYQI